MLVQKFLIVVSISLMILGQSFAQSSVDVVLRKYKNDEGVTTMKYQGENLNKIINKSKKDLKTKLDYIDVIGLSAKDDIDQKDKQTISNILKSQKFDELINVRSKEGKVKIHTLYVDDTIHKIYAQFNSEEFGNYHAILSGKIFLEELGEILSNLNIKELDFLKAASDIK
jgi:hypothetical protein